MPRVERPYYEEQPQPPEPDWGYVSFQGQRVTPVQPEWLMDRSQRQNIPNTVGMPIVGNTRENPMPRGGFEGMVHQMIHSQVNPLAGAMHAAGQAAAGSPAPGPTSFKGGPTPPVADTGAWKYGGMKRGQAGPPAPGGWGPTVVANPPPLRPPPPQTPPGLSSVHPSIYARAEIQQTPRGSGPGAPIPIAFTSAEVRAAVRFVLDFEPIPGLSSQPGGAHWIIAEKTAEVLGRWGNSRGWVRLRSSRGTSPRTFKLADKLYDISHGGRLTGNRPTTPPPGAVPIDLETATTTWDSEQFRSPEQDAGPAWFAPAVALAGDGPGGNPMRPWFGGVRPMPIGPGTQVTGARANLHAFALDALDSAFAAGPPLYGDPYGYAAPFEMAPPAYSEPPETTPPALPPTSVINFFPLVQAHPIKKKKCGCPGLNGGCTC